MLFKILHGDESRISTDITPFHEGYCYVTHSGYMYIDMNIGTVASPNNQRIKLSAKDADTLGTFTADAFVLKAEVSDIIDARVDEFVDGLEADDFGIYVQAQEPTNAVAGDIWIDTANDPSYIPPALPDITAADNGKVLMVVNGKLQLVNLNLSVDANGVLSM